KSFIAAKPSANQSAKIDEGSPSVLDESGGHFSPRPEKNCSDMFETETRRSTASLSHTTTRSYAEEKTSGYSPHLSDWGAGQIIAEASQGCIEIRGRRPCGLSKLHRNGRHGYNSRLETHGPN